MQENWPGICRRLQTEDGKRWVRTKNPCGDYPLHLACYGGHAPPIIIRALVAAHPAAIHHQNNLGYTPLQLARSNYRDGHPFREEVLDYLEAYTEGIDRDGTIANANANANPAEDRNDTSDGHQQQANNEPLILDATSDEAIAGPSNTYVTSTFCVVCLERTADHVVIPCGHLCLCGDCAQKVVASKSVCCPVGRCAIGSIAKVQTQCSGIPVLEVQGGGGQSCVPATT